LPFTLLADEGNKVRKLFGVPKTLFIPGRVTYVVDKTGTVTYVFNNLTDGPKHVTEALEALEKIGK
jgi:peroxiredoxin Q/BCP